MAAAQDRKKVNQSLRDLDIEDVYIKRQLESGSITREQAAQKRLELDVKRTELANSQEQAGEAPGEEGHDKKHKNTVHEEHGAHETHTTEADVTTSNSTSEESHSENDAPSITITSAETFTHPQDSSIPPLTLSERDAKILSDLSDTKLRISNYRDDQASIQKKYEEGKITAQQATNRTEALAQRINKLQAKADRITESRQGVIAATNKNKLELQAAEAAGAQVTSKNVQTSSSTTASASSNESDKPAAPSTPEPPKKNILEKAKSRSTSAAQKYAKVMKYTPLGYAVGKIVGEPSTQETPTTTAPTQRPSPKTAPPSSARTATTSASKGSAIESVRSGAQTAAKTYAKIGKFTPLGYALGKVVNKNDTSSTSPSAPKDRQIGKTGSISFQQNAGGISSNVQEARGYGGQITNQISQTQSRMAPNTSGSTPAAPETNPTVSTTAPNATAASSTSPTQSTQSTGFSSSAPSATFTSSGGTSSGSSSGFSSSSGTFTTSPPDTSNVLKDFASGNATAPHTATTTTIVATKPASPPSNKPPPSSSPPSQGTFGKVKSGAQKTTSGYARVMKYTPLGFVAGKISSRDAERTSAKKTVSELEKTATAQARQVATTPVKNAKPNYFKASAGAAATEYGKFISKTPLGFLVRRLTPQAVKDYVHDVRVDRLARKNAKILEKNISQNTHAAKPIDSSVSAKKPGAIKKTGKATVSVGKAYAKPYIWLARKLRLLPKKDLSTTNTAPSTSNSKTSRKPQNFFGKLLPFKKAKDLSFNQSAPTKVKVKIPGERKTAKQYQELWNKKVLQNAAFLRKYNRAWLSSEIKNAKRNAAVWGNRVWNPQSPNTMVTAGGYFPNRAPARPQQDNRHHTTMHMPGQGNFYRGSYGGGGMSEWTSPRGLAGKAWREFGSPKFSGLNRRLGGRFGGRAANSAARSVAKNAANSVGKKLAQQVGKQAIQLGAKALIANPISLIVIGVVIAIVAIVIIFITLISDAENAGALGGGGSGGGGGAPVPSANPITGIEIALTGDTEANVGDTVTYTAKITYDQSKLPGPIESITVYEDVPAGAEYIEATGVANYNSATKQISWSLASSENRSSITFKLKANQNNTFLNVMVYATMTPGSGAGPGGPPNQDNCNGFYSFTRTINGKAYTSKYGNFADTDCYYANNSPAVRDELHALLKAQDPANADKWFFSVIPCESGYDPNIFNPHDPGNNPNNPPDPNGAWGFFQIGSAAGTNDNGVVNWKQQVTNATTLLKERGWGYWGCQ